MEIEYVNARQSFFCHVIRRYKLENILTTGMIKGKRSRVKRAREDVRWINEVAKFRISERCTKSDEDRDEWKVMMA